MNVYLVGGAVRDELIGREIKEKDWVVVGSTEEDLLAKKFKKINSQFPVFLHPETKEEYALARKEKKVSPCLLYTSPSPRDSNLSRMPSSA